MNKALTDPRDILLKRLYFRSSHRGCKETDLVLGGFAARHLESLDEASLAAYAALLEENDADIWDWLTGAAPPRPEYMPLIALLKAEIAP